jgi:hypothetical protein
LELYRLDFGHSQRRSASEEPFAQHCWGRGILVRNFLLVATLPIFHVGLIYKAVAQVWVFLTCRHFLIFFRNSPADPRD